MPAFGSNRITSAKDLATNLHKQWRGNADNRTPEEVVAQAVDHVTITVGSTVNLEQDITRVTLLLVPHDKIDSFKGKLKEWQTANGGPTKWPNAETLAKWLRDAINNPKPIADLRDEFNSLKQSKPGLEGLDAFTTLFKTKLERLENMKVAPDLYSIKVAFAKGIHSTVMKYVTSIVRESTMLDN